MQLFLDLKQDLLPRFHTYSSIGFFLSGGFDSSLLLYTCSIIKQQENINNKFIAFTVPRYDDSEIHANRIIGWVTQKFQQDIPFIRVGDPDLHHSQQVESGCIAAYEKNLADFFLLGCTATPQSLSRGIVRKQSSWDRLYQPWFNFTKDHTVRLMQELQCYELITLTHSCTESKTQRCGKCWQCCERAWAFSQVGIEDYGTM